VAQLTNKNIIVTKNLQGIVANVLGTILYRVQGLDLLGEPTENTTIEIIKKTGSLKPLASRVETDAHLKGTKRIIVRNKNVYIGIGRKDDRSFIVIPVQSDAPDSPNLIEYLLLLHITLKTDVPLAAKVKALGEKLEHIRNIVQENSIKWKDEYLELVEMQELFGRSAEKTGEHIVSHVS
jgi:glucosamine--fructose-6-phosphate aminotransferase (isomerizing)